MPPPAADGGALAVVPAQEESGVVLGEESGHSTAKSAADRPRGGGPTEKAKPRRRLRAVVDGDELRLPVHIRKARREDSSHWANGYQPKEQLPLTEPPPTAPGEEAADVWMAHLDSEKDERRVKRVMAMEALPAVAGPEEHLSSDDEPRDYELLSPEESEAKRDIWNEVNKDLLEFWALSRKRQQQKSKEAEQRRKQREEKQAQAERNCWEAFAARVERAKRPKERPPPAADKELDTSVVDFWHAHNVANNTVLFPTEREQERDEEVQREEEASRAREAAEALAATLQEEQEEEARRKRYRKAADRINDLFAS